MDCPCGAWHWREARGQEGLAFVEHWCPRCRRRFVVLSRGDELVGVARLKGRDIGSLIEAFDEIGLAARQAGLLVGSARRYNRRRPPRIGPPSA